MEFSKPEGYDEKYKNRSIDDLPIFSEKMKFEVLPKTKYQYKILCELLERSDVDEVICVTDAGREEEIKSFHPKKYYNIVMNFDGMTAESSSKFVEVIAEIEQEQAVTESIPIDDAVKSDTKTAGMMI